LGSYFLVIIQLDIQSGYVYGNAHSKFIDYLFVLVAFTLRLVSAKVRKFKDC